MPADPKVGTRPCCPYRLLSRSTPSVIPIIETPRKPPVDRNFKEDEIHSFKQDHAISDFADITDAFSQGYTSEQHDRAAIVLQTRNEQCT